MSRKKTRSKLAPIYDIDDMIGLFGLKPFDDIDIVFMGMRPGEKLFEELETGGENITKTKHPKIFIGTINTCGDRTLSLTASAEMATSEVLTCSVSGGGMRNFWPARDEFSILNFQFLIPARPPAANSEVGIRNSELPSGHSNSISDFGFRISDFPHAQ